MIDDLSSHTSNISIGVTPNGCVPMTQAGIYPSIPKSPRSGGPTLSWRRPQIGCGPRHLPVNYAFHRMKNRSRQYFVPPPSLETKWRNNECSTPTRREHYDGTRRCDKWDRSLIKCWIPLLERGMWRRNLWEESPSIIRCWWLPPTQDDVMLTSCPIHVLNTVQNLRSLHRP